MPPAPRRRDRLCTTRGESPTEVAVKPGHHGSPISASPGAALPQAASMLSKHSRATLHSPTDRSPWNYDACSSLVSRRRVWIGPDALSRASWISSIKRPINGLGGPSGSIEP